jgi:signal transduction histidine kinase
MSQKSFMPADGDPSSEMTRILLIENKALSLHRLRVETRRSDVPFLYDCAATAAEFNRLLAQVPGIVVSTMDGLADLPLDEIIERTRQANLPLFLVGGDTKEEREMLVRLAGQFSASCRRTRLAWLPMLLERAVGEFRETGERRQNMAQAAAQLQQAAEQMRDVQKLAIIGRLTGSIVHEINNPLESITNLIYLLSTEEQLPEHVRSYVSLAERELKRVTQISKQTLSFYRETETPVRVELSSLLEEVLVLYARRLDEKRITVVRRYESEQPVLLFPGEMRQVYANLLANAIEAIAPGGRLVLRIHRARRCLPSGATVDGVGVLVADSGSGMSPEVRRKLGEPFFTTKGQRGTGLGLWVSQAIVKRYNGEIQLRSSTAPERHGTTFRIFLPLNLGPQMVESGSSGQKTQAGSDASLPAGGLRLRASSS